MQWQELQQASIDAVLLWAETQPWGQAMAQCQQDARWHAEGDVWTHTKMVVRELSCLEAWDSLTKDEQSTLVLTALFHDAAKARTTQIDALTGQITSPKHAVQGEHLARAVLRDCGCDLQTRERIARLVRFHGRPAFLTEKEEPAHEVVRLSWLVNNRLLYLFALADTRGRVTASMDRPEENLHYWKLQSEEVNCYDQPFPFANDHARFLFYRQREPNLHYVPFEDYTCTVTMVCGLPGSGKDTWLSDHQPELPVVSLDALRTQMGVEPKDNQGSLVQAARERCREYLRTGVDFAFNATNTSRSTRSRWIDLFADYQARIEIIYVEPPMPQLLKQNRERHQRVPELVIRRLASKCEPPTWAEAHTCNYATETRPRSPGP